MADRQHQTFRANFHGVNTRLAADALTAGKYPMAVNIRADGDSRIKTRPGYDSGAGGFRTGSSRITDMRAYTALGTDNKPRIIVHDSAGGVWLDDGVQKGTVGKGGTGASLIPYRPNQSPQPWMYVGNATGYSKFSAPNASNAVTAQKVGIAEPQLPPNACPDGRIYYDFTALAANWTQGGDAGAPADAVRSPVAGTDYTYAIFQDPASVSPATKTRYTALISTTAHPSSYNATGSQFSVGETLTFTKSGGGTISAVIEDVIPPLNTIGGVTVQGIYYLNGPTGRCIIALSQFPVDPNNQQTDSLGSPIPAQADPTAPLAGLNRGALLLINTEVVFVLNVVRGPQNQVAIEVSTTNVHAAGESVTGLLGVVVSGLDGTVVDQIVTAAEITSTVTYSSGNNGVGTLTQTLGTNPFLQALGTIGTPQINDFIHCSVAINNPSNVSEVKILFDVGDGTFNSNVLYYAVSANALQAAFTNQQSQIATIQQQTQQQASIDALTNYFESQGYDPEQSALLATQQVTTVGGIAPYLSTLPGGPSGGYSTFGNPALTGNLANIPGYLVPGATQFAEITFPISGLTRVGNDQGNNLGQCTAVRISVKVNSGATAVAYFGSIWVGGGQQPDVGDSGAPYLYRVRPRSSLTGARGNPSPETQYGVVPRRQAVIVSLPSAAYDTQIDTWDIERYGGTVTTWRLIGSASASAATFVDNYFDDTAQAGELLDFDNFEPWPSVDVPWTATVGTAGVTAITVVGTSIVVQGPFTAFLASNLRWLPGTLITLNGQATYTLWNRPVAIAGGALYRIIENAGNPTVTTLFVNEPNVANQPLPYLWGPDANGIIFGAGDPLRPGVLYSAKQFNPDSTPNNIYDLVPPSEPLLGGEVVDGLSFVASSKRWWELQQAFSSPQRWNPIEIPAGRGLAAPFGHCTDGKLIYFWASDGICSMIPGLPAISLTDTDIGNLFPHGGVSGTDITYNGTTLSAPNYQYASRFRLTLSNNILRAHYFDSGGTARCLVLDMSLDASGNMRMAWSADVYANPMTVSYQPEQPRSTLNSTATAYAQTYLADSAGNVYVAVDSHPDVNTAIACVLSVPEWDAGDARINKQFLDALVDIIAQGNVTVIPTSYGAATGTTFVIAGTLADTPTRQLTINQLGTVIQPFMGLTLQWSDAFSGQTTPTTLFEWTAEVVPQPILIKSWSSVPTSHGLQGYHHIRKIVFAYQSYATVILTITAYDGTSPAAITLPNTSGAYQKVEFVPTFNKGLLFTYQGVAGAGNLPWAPILQDCEIYVGQWNRSGPYSVFTGLGGIEAA